MCSHSSLLFVVASLCCSHIHLGWSHQWMMWTPQMYRCQPKGLGPTGSGRHLCCCSCGGGLLRHIPNFLAPSPSRGRPLPRRKISGLKSLGLYSFSCLILRSRGKIAGKCSRITKLGNENSAQSFSGLSSWKALGSWTSAPSGHGCPLRNACFSRISTALTEVLGRDIRANDPRMSVPKTSSLG